MSVYINKVYKHYKGQYYRVLYHAIHTEDETIMVVYQQLYSTDKYAEGFVWVRPHKMFHEIITINNVLTDRFSLVFDYPEDIKNVLLRLDD